MNYGLMLNIRGEELRDIVDGKKKVKYRDIKPFYDVRMAKCKAPFRLRLRNGMKTEAPEIIIEVLKVRREDGSYCLELGEIKSKKNMSKLVKAPKRREREA